MTLFTSEDRKALIGYTGFSVFCMIFSLIYELFSHQVYSVYMIGLAAFPLLFGVAPILVRNSLGMHEPGKVSRTMNFWAVMTLTAGSCLTGVFEIYGTVSAFVGIYWVVGALLASLAVVRYEIEGMEYDRQIDIQEI